MLQAIDDEAIAIAAQRGDREAFRQLIERHYERMYRLAYRYLGTAADAEDAVQEVCIVLASRLGQFAGRSRFSTWVASVVINQCRDHLRRRRASQGLVERYGVMRALEEADAADDQRRGAWLQEALGALEPTLRETALLVVGEEFSHAQAAEALGCAESTVSWRMHLVKKRLRALVDQDDG